MEEQEIFDVVNEKDEVVGQATRDECHNNPALIHRVVHFTLVNPLTGELLLTQRSLKKRSDPGKYCFGGEHVKAGETYESAIKRGIEEELGFTPTVCKEFETQVFTYDKETEIGKFYLVEWHNEELKWTDEDFEKILWVNPNKEAFFDFDLGFLTRNWVERLFKLE